MKHKVGDKVRIRTDLKKYFIYGVYTFTDEMCTLSGKVVTISGVFPKEECYFVEEDKNHFFWTDEMFEDSLKATKELGKINKVMKKITILLSVLLFCLVG